MDNAGRYGPCFDGINRCEWTDIGGEKMKAQKVVPFAEFKPSPSLEKLQMMTEHLAPTLTTKISGEPGNVVEFQMDRGVGVSFGLWNEPAVAVARSTISAGSKFPEHAHDERELILVYSGLASIFLDGKEKVLHPGDSVIVCPGVVHYVVCEEDTKFISVAVPSAPGFPRAD